jgi:K+-transporting ATPase KdpF subunit
VSERRRTVNVLYIVGGVVSFGLLLYLFVALLKPESLS